jgi:hypothetical protein
MGAKVRHFLKPANKREKFFSLAASGNRCGIMKNRDIHYSFSRAVALCCGCCPFREHEAG